MKPLTIILIAALLFISAQVPEALAHPNEGDTIYFIVTDRFKDGDPGNNPTGEIFSADKSEWKLYWGGDLRGVIEKLSYIRNLGCNAIWLTPLVQNTEKLYLYGEKKDEKISGYHGYWADDFFRINKYFGTMEEYKELISQAHKKDIKIIADFVLNHTSPIVQGSNGAIYRDGEFISDYSNDQKGWFHHQGTIDFTISDPRELQDKNLFDLADLNSENPDVEAYLFEAAKMWAETGIDSFRLDTVRHIPVDFAARFNKAMLKINPNLFIFGEWSMGGADVPGAVEFTRETDIHLIDFTFTYKITDVLCKQKSFKLLADHFLHDKNIRNPNLMVTCIDNHDMPRFISTAIDNGAEMDKAKRLTELATYIMMTSRGIPCIYYGTEQFLHVGKRSTWGFGGEPYNRQMMDVWDESGYFFKNISRLAEMRRNTPALAKGLQETLFVSDDVWVFQRRCLDSVVLAAVNKGKKQNVKVDGTHLPDGAYDNSTFQLEKVMGPHINVKHMQTEFQLEPLEIGIWRYRK